MKTKNGNCNCCKCVSNQYVNPYMITTDKNDVNEPDFFIVADIQKNGEELKKFLTSTYSNKKFVIMSHVMCKHDDLEDDDVKNSMNCCFGNFRFLSNKLNSKNKFIFDLKYDCKTDDFVNVKNIDELKQKIDEIYNIQEDIKYHCFQIPEDYYTDKYRLVDVQYINFEDRLIYIFRDKDNNKCCYDYPSTNNNFYWYESVASNRIVEKIDNLKFVTGKYKNRNVEKNGYGGDINICTQHCVDYYLKSKKEAPIIRQNIMFLDIETYQDGDKIFPDPDEANYPIVAISFRTDKEDDYTHVYLVALDGKIDNRVYDEAKKYKHVTVFNDEKTMLRTWFMKIKSESIDIFSGWNSFGFDFPYIINRVKKLGIDQKEVNGFGNLYGNSDRGSSIPGYVLLDQLKLFKEFHHGILPSYSLDNVSKLTLGYGKVDHTDMSIDDMYQKHIDMYLKYSTTDTDLIYDLEKSLGHISLQVEIRTVATCSHSQANSSLGQANGLYATRMKKQGLIARNYQHDIEKLNAFRGAYVFDARPGIYDGLLCDFDFKSLYPSIICTWNIGPDTYIGKISEEDAYTYVFFKDRLKTKKIKLCVDPLYANKNIIVTLNEFESFIKKYNAQVTIIGTIFCGHDIKESINYKVLNMLLDSRSLYKDKMLNAKEAGEMKTAREYNDKQLAFKILANMLYGALGQEHFRFFNPVLGESITVTGQEMIKYSAVHTDYFMEGKFKNDDPKYFTIDPTFADKVKRTKNVVYGDTDSIFVYLTDYLKKKNLPCKKCPEVLKAVSDVQMFINGTILPTLLVKHNVKLNKSQMYLKNEFLMNRYYALNAKKKYASRIISQEGKDINEVDIKGLEIKRSEVPSRSQKMLKEMLDVILDANNTKLEIKSKLDKIVKDSREDIKNLTLNGDLSVAKVVSYSKKMDEYKVMPQHLLGMLTWNCLLGIEDFKYGSKGKLFNVLGINLNKAPSNVVDNYYKQYMVKFPNTPIEAIVVPENVDKLPDYFIVDLKTTVEYACDDRANLLMSGLFVESDNDLLF